MSNIVKKNFQNIFSDFENEFNNTFLGFDNFFEPMKKMNMLCESSFPPYDIYKEEVEFNGKREQHLFVELACAGIGKDNLVVSLSPNNILTIKTDYKDEKEVTPRKFYHNGIAYRSFEFKRSLQPNMKVVKVSYIDGILRVELRTKENHSETVHLEIE